ncbi:MAG: hypothetical protein ACLS29_09885 [Prevotellamassilia sp.]
MKPGTYDFTLWGAGRSSGLYNRGDGNIDGQTGYKYGEYAPTTADVGRK